MTIQAHDDFLQAIHGRREVRVSFRSKDDHGAVLTRRCAPMDYAPSARAKDKTPRYHFWDFESDSGASHVLSLLANQILDVEVLESGFDPAEFVTWSTNWNESRSTWGPFN